MSTVNLLRAGVARRNLFVPKRIYQIGYGDRLFGCKSVHDALTATVLCLSEEATRLLIVALDMLVLNEHIVQRIRRQITSRWHIPSDHILIHCSHTHSAPIAYANDKSKRSHRRFIDGLIETVTAAAGEALDNTAPAELEWGQGEAHIAVNRRQVQPDGSIIIGVNPAGPVDREIALLRIRFPAAGQRSQIREPITLVNFACHPTVLGPSNRQISADWPGFMRQAVEEATGGTVLFLQGATGDLNPNHEWGADDMSAAERLGLQVAEQVIGIMDGRLQPVDASGLFAAREAVLLPLVPQHRPDGTAIGYREPLAKMVKLPEFLVDPILSARYPWKSTLVHQDGQWHTLMEVQTMRIGACALVAQAGEIFNEIGAEIKRRSPAAFTLFAGYSNGCIGYLPTREAHSQGGYEVEITPYLYRMPGLLDPECQHLVTSRTLQMLGSLYSDQHQADAT